jgi:ankyrin repeat protein
MLAHKFGHHDVFRLLMQRSSIGLRFAIACEVGDEELAQSLLTKHPGLIVNQPPAAYRRLIGAALRNNTRSVGMMLHAGWPVDVRGNHEQTALHWAAFHGNQPMVRELVDHRAPLEAEEQQFKGTPLSWALYGSQHGWLRDAGDYPATVKTLLAAGAKFSGSIDDLEAPEEVLEVMRRHTG